MKRTSWVVLALMLLPVGVVGQQSGVEEAARTITEADFDCRIELVQEGVCGPGYYDERDDSTTTTAVLMDCSGVSDEYESTFSSHEGYLRIDTIDAGSESGSFAGEPLSTTLEGYLHVWTPEGIDVQGDLILSLIQIAGDSEEGTECSVLLGDEDDDGGIDVYFDGTDCDDGDEHTFAGAAESDDTLACMTDADEDGYGSDTPAPDVTAGTDCDDTDSSLLSVGDCDADGIPTEDDCDDEDPDISITTFFGDLVYSDEVSFACASIEGDLSIAPHTTSLVGLAGLNSVSGSLHINNTTLTSFALDSLTDVGGDLMIQNNDALTSLSMDGVTTVGALWTGLEIQNNPALTAFSLDTLTAVEGGVFIHHNGALSSAELGALATISQDLKIYDNAALTSFSLDSVTTVGFDIVINYNFALTSFSLDNLTTVGSLFINNNDTLCESIVGAFVDALTALGWHGSLLTGGNADC